MLDEDLAALYDVPTKRLNEQVSRNRERFPNDFMFRLTAEELGNLRSQNATSSWGGRRYPPRAFTEQGVAMLSSVLRSRQAAQMNVAIMRTFVQLRGLLASHEELASKLNEMEKTYDAQFKAVFEAIRELMKPEAPTRRRIGFSSSETE